MYTNKNPGIFRDRTMDDKFMYNPNYDKQNYPNVVQTIG